MSITVEYSAIQTEAVCLKAVALDGYALRYVLELSLFVKIAAALRIRVTNIPKTEASDAA